MGCTAKAVDVEHRSLFFDGVFVQRRKSLLSLSYFFFTISFLSKMRNLFFRQPWSGYVFFASLGETSLGEANIVRKWPNVPESRALRPSCAVLLNIWCDV